MKEDNVALLTEKLIKFFNSEIRGRGFAIKEIDLALINVAFYIRLEFMQKRGIKIYIPNDWWKM